MSPETSHTPKSHHWARLLVVFVIAFDVAAFWQWMDGALQSEFGGHVNEAMHYVAGLSLRDAVAGLREGGENAARISNLLSNQPKPDSAARAAAFAASEAGWMLLFGTSRLAALLFMAALAAASAALIFVTVQREFGNWAAAVAALLWLCAPAVRESYEVIMPDLFNAFALTGAVLCWARLFEGGRFRDALWSGALSAAVILGNGGALVLAIPPLLMLMPGHRLRTLAQPATWLAFSILGGLWLWRRPVVAWQFELPAIAYWLKEFTFVLGPAAVACAFGGLLARWRSAPGIGATWIAMSSLVIGAVFTRWIVASGLEMRSLIPMTPALAMLAAVGAVSLAGVGATQPLASNDRRRREILWVFLLLLLSIPECVLNGRRKDWQGFGPVALTLLEKMPKDARVLVASDARGEGMLISEIAMRDRQKGILIERGSDSLVVPGDFSSRGRPTERFLEDEHLSDYLASGRIQYIVLDSSVPESTRAPYHDQIQRVIEGDNRRFWPIFSSPITRDGEPQGHPLRVFRVMPPGGSQE